MNLESTPTPAPILLPSRPACRGVRGWVVLLLVIASLLFGMLLGHIHSGMPRYQLHVAREFIGVIDDINRIASSSTETGVAAVMGAGEEFKSNDEALAFYEKVLPQTSDPVVQRAIRIKLAELYKKTGKTDKAADNLEKLITGKP